MSINPSIITFSHAESVLERASRYNDQGTIQIDGIDVDWWCDGSAVGFYESGHDGEATIKRYEVQKQVYEA